MSGTEKLIAFIKSEVNIGGNIYFGNIPAKKLANAQAAMGTSPDEEIIVLVDDTVFGSAKEGILITSWGARQKTIDSTWNLSWEELQDYSLGNVKGVLNKEMPLINKKGVGKKLYSTGGASDLNTVKQIILGGIKIFGNREAPTQASATEAAASFCVNCGNKLQSGTKFCPKCGAKVACVDDDAKDDDTCDDDEEEDDCLSLQKCNIIVWLYGTHDNFIHFVNRFKSDDYIIKYMSHAEQDKYGNVCVTGSLKGNEMEIMKIKFDAPDTARTKDDFIRAQLTFLDFSRTKGKNCNFANIAKPYSQLLGSMLDFTQEQVNPKDRLIVVESILFNFELYGSPERIGCFLDNDIFGGISESEVNRLGISTKVTKDTLCDTEDGEYIITVLAKEPPIHRLVPDRKDFKLGGLVLNKTNTDGVFRLKAMINGFENGFVMMALLKLFHSLFSQ